MVVSTESPSSNQDRLCLPALHLRNGPGTTGDSLVAALAIPDTDSSALDGVLAAKRADVSGVLCDFHLLHLLSERCTVSVQSCQSYRLPIHLSFEFKLVASVVVVVEVSYLVPYLPVTPTSINVLVYASQ